jgi:hypothetical protein
VLDEVKHDFRDHSYNIIFKNCNHFSEAFIRILLGKDIPAYVNRLAYIGSYFSCFFPDSMVNQAPVNEPGYSGSVRASASRSGAAGGSNAHAFTASKGHRLQGTWVELSHTNSLYVYIYMHSYVVCLLRCGVQRVWRPRRMRKMSHSW